MIDVQEPKTGRPGLPWWSALVVELLCLPLKLYRATLSRVLAPACRFHPSCSRYALDALREHGATKGLALAAYRIVRCHPFHPGGLDPVPPRRVPPSAR